MLRVRVYIVLKTPVGAERLIWDEVAPSKDEKKLAEMVQAFAADPKLVGELMGLRLRNGKGRGCTVNGSMLGCEVSEQKEETIAEVRFYDDDWRVW